MRIFAGQLSMLTCIACSPDGKEIAVGAEDGSVSVWDISSAKRRLLLRKHAGAVWSVAYSRDATVLVSASEDCSLAIWDASTAGASSEENEQQATKGGSSAEVRAAAMSLPTKAAGVAAVTFTRRNLCLGIGPR
jgi:transcription initiation factor TFIID subunit 5